MATIRALHHSILLIIPLGDDGLAKVVESFLSLRFRFHSDSIHVEEEVFNDNGDLSHTVIQMSFCIDDGRVWFLLPGTYKAIGVTKSVMATTTVLLTPGVFLTSTTHAPFVATIKKEPGLEEVTLLSNDSDDDVPLASDIASLTPPPSQDQPFINPLRISHSRTISQPSTSRPPIHPGVSKDRPSVIHHLELLATRPGSKNILKFIDYESIDLEKVDVLPSVFDGDVIFEFPPLGADVPHSHARFMFEMDKRFNGHAWCKTKTSNITNDLGLTFRFSCCVGHLRFDDKSCIISTAPIEPLTSTRPNGKVVFSLTLLRRS